MAIRIENPNRNIRSRHRAKLGCQAEGGAVK
jgi:hypothetical protein